MSQSTSASQLPSISMDGSQTVVKVFLVNGESRSLRLDERTDVSVSSLLGVPEGGSGCPGLGVLPEGVGHVSWETTGASPAISLGSLWELRLARLPRCRR